MKNITQITENLKTSPMFNLSLSSKELFHSNFLYWLSLTYPDKIGAFFAELCKLELEDKNCTEQKREENNIDFQFSYKNGTTIYVENKVKSMPYLEQLERYGKEKESIKNKKMVLLSLTAPDFSRPDNWEYLTYQSYNDFLKRFETKDIYHKALIDDYTKLIDNLLIIEKMCDINVDRDIFDFHSSEILKEMKALRLHDLFLKKKYSNLAAMLQKKTKAKFKNLAICDLGKFLENKDNVASSDNPEIYFESGFLSHSQGAMGFKFRLKDYFFLLVQLQGESYRIGIEYLPPKKQSPKITPNEFEKIVETFNESWFCYFNNKKNRIKNECDKWTIYPKNEKKKYNQFGIFFYYRYINLGSELFIRELIDIMIEDIARAIDLRNEYMNLTK